MEMTVIDPGSEDLAGKIAAGCAADGLTAADISIRRVASANEVDQAPDLVVLAPETDFTAGRRAQQPAACGILLLPGDADADDFDADCVVTYGMSPKNTLTLSSIGEDACVVALQRELLTVSGDMLERQEFKVKSGMRPESLLAVAGALLILGRTLPETNP